MSSIVARESLLRKLSFPRLSIPTSMTLAAAITLRREPASSSASSSPGTRSRRARPGSCSCRFCSSSTSSFSASRSSSRRCSSASGTSARSGSSQRTLILYATPIIYPVGFLPEWARTIAFLNPLTQILQDFRAIVLYQDVAPNLITASEAFDSSAGRLIPIGITFGIFGLGLWMFKKQEPWFAERV